MVINNEAHGRFLAKNLIYLTREIRRFVNIYPVEFAVYEDKSKVEWFDRFNNSGKKMLDELENILLIANKTIIKKYCNLEQIEAIIEEAKATLYNLTEK